MAVFAALCGLGTRTLTLHDISIPSASSWTNNDPFYECTVSVPQITSNDDPIIDVQLTGDPETDALYLDAWSRITNITTIDGGLKIQAYLQAPGSAFTIKLKAVR